MAFGFLDGDSRGGSVGDALGRLAGAAGEVAKAAIKAGARNIYNWQNNRQNPPPLYHPVSLANPILQMPYEPPVYPFYGGQAYVPYVCSVESVLVRYKDSNYPNDGWQDGSSRGRAVRIANGPITFCGVTVSGNNIVFRVIANGTTMDDELFGAYPSPRFEQQIITTGINVLRVDGTSLEDDVRVFGNPDPIKPGIRITRTQQPIPVGLLVPPPSTKPTEFPSTPKPVSTPRSTPKPSKPKPKEPIKIPVPIPPPSPLPPPISIPTPIPIPLPPSIPTPTPIPTPIPTPKPNAEPKPKSPFSPYVRPLPVPVPVPVPSPVIRPIPVGIPIPVPLTPVTIPSPGASTPTGKTLVPVTPPNPIDLTKPQPQPIDLTKPFVPPNPESDCEKMQKCLKDMFSPEINLECPETEEKDIFDKFVRVVIEVPPRDDKRFNPSTNGAKEDVIIAGYIRFTIGGESIGTESEVRRSSQLFYMPEYATSWDLYPCHGASLSASLITIKRG